MACVARGCLQPHCEEAAEASQSYTKCCLCPVTFGRLINLSEIPFFFFEVDIIARPCVGGREAITCRAGLVDSHSFAFHVIWAQYLQPTLCPVPTTDTMSRRWAKLMLCFPFHGFPPAHGPEPQGSCSGNRIPAAEKWGP